MLTAYYIWKQDTPKQAIIWEMEVGENSNVWGFYQGQNPPRTYPANFLADDFFKSNDVFSTLQEAIDHCQQEGLSYEVNCLPKSQEER
jgi:hypothetical protein